MNNETPAPLAHEVPSLTSAEPSGRSPAQEALAAQRAKKAKEGAKERLLSKATLDQPSPNIGALANPNDSSAGTPPPSIDAEGTQEHLDNNGIEQSEEYPVRNLGSLHREYRRALQRYPIDEDLRTKAIETIRTDLCSGASRDRRAARRDLAVFDKLNIAAEPSASVQLLSVEGRNDSLRVLLGELRARLKLPETGD